MIDSARKLYETMMEYIISSYSRKLKFDHSLKSQTKALIIMDQRQVHAQRLFKTNLNIIRVAEEEKAEAMKKPLSQPSAWFYGMDGSRVFY